MFWAPGFPACGLCGGGGDGPLWLASELKGPGLNPAPTTDLLGVPGEVVSFFRVSVYLFGTRPGVCHGQQRDGPGRVDLAVPLLPGAGRGQWRPLWACTCEREFEGSGAPGPCHVTRCLCCA